MLSIRLFFFLVLRRPPTSTLFPYTTLFRSVSVPSKPIFSWVPSQNGLVFDLPHLHSWYESRSEEHTSELQSQSNLVCRLLHEKKNTRTRSTVSFAVIGAPSGIAYASSPFCM